MGLTGHNHVHTSTNQMSLNRGKSTRVRAPIVQLLQGHRNHAIIVPAGDGDGEAGEEVRFI